MRSLILASLLLLPAVALASDPSPCKVRAERNLDLDLSGVRSVRFVVNSFQLHLEGGAPAGKATLRGVACGSDQATVDSLVVTQEKHRDTLVVGLTDTGRAWTGWGSHYSDLQVDAAVPATMPVAVEVGSGSATVHGVASLDSVTGSGDIDVHGVSGHVRARLGSGDFKSDGSGAIDVDAVGSGDFAARNVHGDVHVRLVGSGDVTFTGVDGSVEAGTLGSGDLTVDGVKGNLSVRTQGSGDIEHHNVSGKVSVPNNDR